MAEKHGLRFIVGRPKRSQKTAIQSILFDKGAWTPSRAKAWLRRHSFRYGDMDKGSERAEYLRFRQRDPAGFQAGTLRTIAIGADRNPEVPNPIALGRLEVGAIVGFRADGPVYEVVGPKGRQVELRDLQGQTQFVSSETPVIHVADSWWEATNKAIQRFKSNPGDPLEDLGLAHNPISLAQAVVGGIAAGAGLSMGNRVAGAALDHLRKPPPPPVVEGSGAMVSNPTGRYQLIGTDGTMRVSHYSNDLAKLRKWGERLTHYAIYMTMVGGRPFYNATDEAFLVEHKDDPYWENHLRRQHNPIEAGEADNAAKKWAARFAAKKEEWERPVAATKEEWAAAAAATKEEWAAVKEAQRGWLNAVNNRAGAGTMEQAAAIMDAAMTRYDAALAATLKRQHNPIEAGELVTIPGLDNAAAKVKSRRAGGFLGTTKYDVELESGPQAGQEVLIRASAVKELNPTQQRYTVKTWTGQNSNVKTFTVEASSVREAADLAAWDRWKGVSKSLYLEPDFWENDAKDPAKGRYTVQAYSIYGEVLGKVLVSQYRKELNPLWKMTCPTCGSKASNADCHNHLIDGHWTTVGGKNYMDLAIWRRGGEYLVESQGMLVPFATKAAATRYMLKLERRRRSNPSGHNDGAAGYRDSTDVLPGPWGLRNPAMTCLECGEGLKLRSNSKRVRCHGCGALFAVER